MPIDFVTNLSLTVFFQLYCKSLNALFVKNQFPMTLPLWFHCGKFDRNGKTIMAHVL